VGLNWSTIDISFVLHQAHPKPARRTSTGQQSRHRDTPMLIVRLCHTHGSCGHSATSFVILCLFCAALSQRQRESFAI